MLAQRKFLVIFIIVLTLVATASMSALASARLVEGTIRSFVVNIAQSVPAEISAPIELSSGEVITVTAPITVNVELRVSVDGNGAVTIINEAVEEPSIGLSVAVPSPTDATQQEKNELVDDLGIPYSLEIDSSDYSITEWDVFADTNGQFNIAGQLNLTADTEPFQGVIAEVRFYDANDNLIDIEDIANVDLRLAVDGYSRFSSRFSLFVEDIDHYTVTFSTVR